MATSLEDALKGQLAPKGEDPVQEPKEEPPVEESQEESQEELKEEPQEEAAPPAAQESKQVPLAAVLDERGKRQAAEDKAKALEERLKELETTPTTDFWEAPEERLKEIETTLRQEFDQKFQSGLLAYSMQSASYRHDDYEDALAAFKKAAGDNPALADQVFSTGDPGEYIYSTGKQFLQLEEVGGDINSLREKIRNEERAKLLKELKANPLQDVPSAITDETNASAPSEKPEAGPTPLSKIFPNQR